MSEFLEDRHDGKYYDRSKEDKYKSNEKEKFTCSYCGDEWEKKTSKTQHERWCKSNPNARKHKNDPKVKNPLRKEFTIKDIKEIDRVFGLTDEQIANFIRGVKKK